MFCLFLGPLSLCLGHHCTWNDLPHLLTCQDSHIFPGLPQKLPRPHAPSSFWVKFTMYGKRSLLWNVGQWTLPLKTRERVRKLVIYRNFLSVKNPVVHCTNSTIPLAIRYVIIALTYCRLLDSWDFYIHPFGPPCPWLRVNAQQILVEWHKGDSFICGWSWHYSFSGLVFYYMWKSISCSLYWWEGQTRRDSTRGMMIFIQALDTQCSSGTTQSQSATAESWRSVGLRMGSG